MDNKVSSKMEKLIFTYSLSIKNQLFHNCIFFLYKFNYTYLIYFGQIGSKLL